SILPELRLWIPGSRPCGEPRNDGTGFSGTCLVGLRKALTASLIVFARRISTAFSSSKIKPESSWENHAASNRQQTVLRVMNENKSKEVSKLVKGVGDVQHFQRTCSFASCRGARSSCGIRLYAFCKRLRILVHGRSLHYAGRTSASGKMSRLVLGSHGGHPDPV